MSNKTKIEFNLLSFMEAIEKIETYSQEHASTQFNPSSL